MFFLEPTTSTLLGVLILILDIYAIASVLMGSSPVERKLLWIVVIVLLPVIGMILYFLIGRTSADARRPF
jgi:hypothetical protein